MKSVHCIGLLSLFTIQSHAIEKQQKAVEVHPDYVVTRRSMGDIKVGFKNGKFFTKQGNKVMPTCSHMNDKTLQSMDIPKLAALLKSGSLHVMPHGNQFYLNAHQRLNGGGPVFGFLGYWGTKGIVYAAGSLGLSALTNRLTGRRRTAANALSTATTRLGQAIGVVENPTTGLLNVAAEAVGDGIVNTMNSATSHAETLVGASIVSGVSLSAIAESAATWVGGSLLACVWLP